MDVHELLLKVQNHEVDLASAEEYLKKLPYEDLGFAKLDHHRRCAPGLARSFTVPERRRSIWYGYSRALRNERAMFSERGQQRNSLRLFGKCFLRPCMKNFHGQSIFSISAEAGRPYCGLHRRNFRYSGGRRSGADGRIFRLLCRPDL